MAETVALALYEAGAIELGTALTIFEGAAVINAVALLAAEYAYGQDQQRRARNQARDAYNSGLQDRTVTIRSAVAPRAALYGRAKIGGVIVDAFSTGTKGEYLHVVVAFAGHECDACETIYLNNVALPAPDGSGFIQSGQFAKTVTTVTTETTSSAGSLTLSQTPSRIIQVTKSLFTGSPEDRSTVELAETTGYTLAGAVVTFVPGAGFEYQVTYEYQTVVPKVRVKVHLGQSGQTADSDLVSESSGRWTSNDVGQGIAYIYFRFEYDVDVFGQVGLPEPTAVWRGKKILDPRSSTTAWSDNWALCVRDYLRDANFGLGCSSTEVIDSEINTAANIADEEVTLHNTGTVTVTNGSPNVTGSGTTWTKYCYPGLLFVSTDATRYTVSSVTDDTHLVLTANYGGSTLSAQSYSLRQKRYTVNGALGTEVQPLQNLRKLLGCGAGTAVWVQGRWLVRAGAYLTPSTTLTEDYLADGAINIVPRASKRDQCNRVSGTFLDANALYAEKQYPPQVNTTYKAADGGIELTREVSVWGVIDSYRAQRLAKIEMERSRQAMTATASFNHRAYDYAPTDTTQLTLSRYGWSAKVFEIRSRKFTPAVGLEYVLKETASTVFDWALGNETLYSAANATSLPNPYSAPPALSGLACDSSATYNQNLASSITVRGYVSWTASTDVFVQQGGKIEVGWKLDSDTAWQTNALLPGDRTSDFILPLQPARLTLIRVRAINALGRVGPWTYLSHQVQSGGIVGGGNLLRNSSFEVDSDGDGLADSWLPYASGTTGTVTRALVSGGVTGGKYQQISATGLGTASTDQAGVHQIVELAGMGGKPFAFSPYVRALGGGTGGVDIRLYIDWYSAAGGTGTIVGSSSKVIAAADTDYVNFARLLLQDRIPVTALSARVYVWMAARGGSTGAAHFDLDAAQSEVGAVPTAYAPRADELLAGVVATTHIAENAATEVGQHDYSAGGTTFGDGGVVTSFTFTPAADANIEFTATVEASGIDLDAGNNLRWRVTPDGGSTSTVTTASGADTARRVIPMVGTYAAVGGVELTFELKAVKSGGTIAVYQTFARYTAVYR